MYCRFCGSKLLILSDLASTFDHAQSGKFKITVFDPLLADVEKRLHDLILTVASSEDHTAVLKSRRCIPRIKLFRRFIKSLDLQMKTLSSNQQEERQFLTAFKAKNKIPRFFSWALNY